MHSVKNSTALNMDLIAIKAEIAHIRTLSVNDLRPLWSRTFNKEVPHALTKDIIARMLIWRLQEQAIGGFDRATLRTLDGYAKGSSPETKNLRRLKPGTELVREYQGERHNVIIMSDGFAWRGITYKSLTTIAKEITGTSWNGPRFFGLRVSEGARAGAQTSPSPITDLQGVTAAEGISK